jgi:hypothetical protein
MQYAALSQSKVNRTLMKIGGAGAIASGVLFIAGLILHIIAGLQVDLIARLDWIAGHGPFNTVIGLISLFAWAALIPAVPAFYEAAKDRSGALTPVGTLVGAVGVVLGLLGGLVLLTGETVLAQAEADTAVILVNIQLIELFSSSLRQFAYVLLAAWLALNGLVNVRLGKAARHWLGFGWYSLILAGLVTVLAVLWLIGMVNLELAVVVLFGVAAIWLGISLLQTR